LAKTPLPDPLSRRYLLEKDMDPARAATIAAAYLEAGREIEAIEFLARADDREGLARLCETAVLRGDVFLMRSASGALGEEPDASAWQRLAQAAREAGRERDVETATRLAAVGV